MIDFVFMKGSSICLCGSPFDNLWKKCLVWTGRKARMRSPAAGCIQTVLRTVAFNAGSDVCSHENGGRHLLHLRLLCPGGSRLAH